MVILMLIYDDCDSDNCDCDKDNICYGYSRHNIRHGTLHYRWGDDHCKKDSFEILSNTCQPNPSSKDIFYELENLSEIKDRTILKLFETDGSGRGWIVINIKNLSQN